MVVSGKDEQLLAHGWARGVHGAGVCRKVERLLLITLAGHVENGNRQVPRRSQTIQLAAFLRARKTCHSGDRRRDHGGRHERRGTTHRTAYQYELRNPLPSQLTGRPHDVAGDIEPKVEYENHSAHISKFLGIGQPLAQIALRSVRKGDPDAPSPRTAPTTSSPFGLLKLTARAISLGCTQLSRAGMVGELAARGVVEGWLTVPQLIANTKITIETTSASALKTSRV